MENQFQNLIYMRFTMWVSLCTIGYVPMDLGDFAISSSQIDAVDSLGRKKQAMTTI